MSLRVASIEIHWNGGKHIDISIDLIHKFQSIQQTDTLESGAEAWRTETTEREKNIKLF